MARSTLCLEPSASLDWSKQAFKFSISPRPNLRSLPSRDSTPDPQHPKPFPNSHHAHAPAHIQCERPTPMFTRAPTSTRRHRPDLYRHPRQASIHDFNWLLTASETRYDARECHKIDHAHINIHNKCGGHRPYPH